MSLACVSWSVTLAVNLEQNPPWLPWLDHCWPGQESCLEATGQEQPAPHPPLCPQALLLASLMAVLLLAQAQPGPSRYVWALTQRPGWRKAPADATAGACGHGGLRVCWTSLDDPR